MGVCPRNLGGTVVRPADHAVAALDIVATYMMGSVMWAAGEGRRRGTGLAGR